MENITAENNETLDTPMIRLRTAEEKLADNLAYGSVSPLTKIFDGDRLVMELPGKLWQCSMESYEAMNPWYPELIKYSLLMDAKEWEGLKDPDAEFLRPRFKAMMRLLGMEFS